VNYTVTNALKDMTYGPLCGGRPLRELQPTTPLQYILILDSDRDRLGLHAGSVLVVASSRWVTSSSGDRVPARGIGGLPSVAPWARATMSSSNVHGGARAAVPAAAAALLLLCALAMGGAAVCKGSYNWTKCSDAMFGGSSSGAPGGGCQSSTGASAYGCCGWAEGGTRPAEASGCRARAPVLLSLIWTSCHRSSSSNSSASMTSSASRSWSPTSADGAAGGLGIAPTTSEAPRDVTMDRIPGRGQDQVIVHETSWIVNQVYVSARRGGGVHNPRACGAVSVYV
jgi:hypothetical protein